MAVQCTPSYFNIDERLVSQAQAFREILQMDSLIEPVVLLKAVKGEIRIPPKE